MWGKEPHIATYSTVSTTKHQTLDFEFPFNSDSETTAGHMSMCQPAEFVILLNSELFFSDYRTNPHIYLVIIT